ncbi:MAG: aldehyde dehydrogenase family protein [Planctomycetes bacterium]|nr:aldehyde dehydrogenase family protein [Planctomycetota bacterium]MCH9723375.1 aldehyde dehydrogenase family protein [Planctomycetota bacterium]MCH9779050.1 aldehyde dehydrogenase family protein [Planctomycetota bacterium]MCH9790291.1 aldehyde dehydrogenase family protein [Planctomycetota bacterium]
MTHPIHEVLQRIGVSGQPAAVAIGTNWQNGAGDLLTGTSPIDGVSLVTLQEATLGDVGLAVDTAKNAFLKWRQVPAPRRGEFVRLLGDALRKHKTDLATIVSWEAGKITQEALGEVQEMIDICDFAVGLSRQLYGSTIASERPGHRLMEQWHPLGPVGIISAFNFPVAVWAWNSMLAFVCGDSVIWKPSEKTPLCAIACQQIVNHVAQNFPEAPDGISNLLIGRAAIGKALSEHHEIPLISATGSVPMGRAVATTVASRLGRSLLELGGNNAMIVTESADLEMTVRSALFSAVGTCGQRCTTLRRLIVHENIADQLLASLKNAYQRLPIGNPLTEGTLVGPLVDQAALDAMQQALKTAKKQGGIVHFGHQLVEEDTVKGYYVHPAIVEMESQTDIVQQETFAPILYVMRYQTLEEAIEMHNQVPQGLSSAIMTNDVREAELFCSPVGSDCGIANVNVGPSGAEIGGAFGGEKETGGGRESGSDSWKAYMRRTTNTINYSTELPLAQGIKFDL